MNNTKKYILWLVYICISSLLLSCISKKTEENLLEDDFFSIQTNEVQENNNAFDKAQEEQDIYSSVIEGSTIEKDISQKEEHNKKSPIMEIMQANTESLQEPTEHVIKNSLVVYNYWRNFLYKVYTSPQRVTLIRLGEEEDLVGELISGDTANWIIAVSSDRNKSIIYIKPIQANISTNLIINTTKRTYHLLLVSLEQTYMVSVEWRYPKTNLVQTEEKKNILEVPISLEKLYFGYKIIPYRKEPLWTPSKVFDDGIRTYIQFSNRLYLAEYPALFITDNRGKSSLINYRVIDDYYVLDRILYKGELRIGKKKRDAIKIVRIKQ